MQYAKCVATVLVKVIFSPKCTPYTSPVLLVMFQRCVHCHCDLNLPVKNGGNKHVHVKLTETNVTLQKVLLQICVT